MLFPEGARQSGPVVQPLFEGAAFVAARAGVPIVPVGIGGSEWAMPKGRGRSSRSRSPWWSAIPSLPPERTGGRVSRRAVSSLTEQLASSLQAVFDEALREAGRA